MRVVARWAKFRSRASPRPRVSNDGRPPGPQVDANSIPKPRSSTAPARRSASSAHLDGQPIFLSRVAFGRRVSQWQAVATELATAATKLDAARMLCYRGLWKRDQGQRHDEESSMAKWWGVMVANEVIATCMRLNGHYGWAKDLPHEQRLRDCLGMESADGPREIHLGIIARGLLGKDASPF